jgi:cytidylate kinase
VDASLIVADANKQHSIPGSEWSKELNAQEVSRAAKEYLATPRRRGIRGSERRHSKVCVTVRSGCTMDGRDARTRVLCLRRQLSG